MNMRTVSVAVVLALCASGSAAAANHVAIHEAVYIAAAPPNNPHIEVVFESSFGTTAAAAAAGNKANYRVLDLLAGSPGSPRVTEIAVTPKVATLPSMPAEQSNTVQLVIDAGSIPAVAENRYIVIASNLTFGAKNVPVDPAPAPITMSGPGAAPAALLRPQWSKTKDRDSADVYFSGSLSRSQQTAFYGSADIKVRYPLLEPTFWSRVHWFAPQFDLQASKNPDADPDSMTIGGSWLWYPVQRSRGSLPILQWENAPALESSKNFDQRNFVWRSELTALPQAVRMGKAGNFWVNPVAGVAAGRILKVPGDIISTGPIFRTLVGFSATFEMPIPSAKKLSLNATYEHRQLHQQELVGDLTLEQGGHHWVTAKAEIQFTDLISLGANFEDGEKPPKYRAVHRSLTFDLTFKAARKNKKQ